MPCGMQSFQDFLNPLDLNSYPGTVELQKSQICLKIPDQSQSPNPQSPIQTQGRVCALRGSDATLRELSLRIVSFRHENS